jgi:rSAM/selenodomain-associated transferase 2
VRVSVVIPALDEGALIGAAVESASREGVEVLVVDGGSRDATPERAKRAGATVLPSPPGRARQLGVGASSARGDVVLFLHADSTLPSGWDAALRSALADEEVAGGAFRFRFDDRSLQLRLVEWGARARVALLRVPYGDQALFVRRRVLESMGGVPQAPIMEDLDLVREIKRRGRLALLPLPVTTSARRYRARGIARTVLRNAVAAAGWTLGLERRRIAEWYRR